MKVRQHHKKGFVLVEFLISLLVFVVSIQIVVSLLVLIDNTNQFDEIVQDQIALIQMRRECLLASDFSLTDDGLAIKDGIEDKQFAFKNRHIILHPGTQIMISNIDDAYFFKEENHYYVTYERNGKRYTYYLAKT